MRTLLSTLLVLALAMVARAGLDLGIDNGVPVRAEAVAEDDVTFRCRIPAGARLRADVRPRSKRRTWSLRMVRVADDFEVTADENRGKLRLWDVDVPTTGWYTFTVRADGEGDGRFQLRATWSTPSRFPFDGELGEGGLDVPFVADAGSTVRVTVKARKGTIPTVLTVSGTTTGADVEVLPDSHASLRKARVRTGVVAETDDFVVRVGEVGRTGARVAGSVRVLRGPRTRGTARAEAADYAGQSLATPLFGRTIGGRGGRLTLDLPQANSLNGCAVSIPAPAIRRAAAITIGEAAALEAPSSEQDPIGPPVYFGPDDRLFRDAVRVTLAVDPDTTSDALAEVVVMRRDASGEVTQVPRQLVDVADATVTVLTDDLATFRAFVPRAPDVVIGAATHLGDDELPELLRLGHAVAATSDMLLVGAPDTSDRAGTAVVYRRGDATWAVDGVLSALQSAAFDEFGGAVAISGSTAVVGARFTDGEEEDEGACYVFERGVDEWSPATLLVAPDAALYDEFGGAVAIDGDTLAIGARLDDDHGDRSGSVYVFRRHGDGWLPWQKLTVEDAGAGAELGSSLSIHQGTLAVGAPSANAGDGAVFVFQQVDQRWVAAQRVEPTPHRAGAAFGAALCVHRDELVVGAPGGAEGAAYAFSRRGGTWQSGRLLSSGATVGASVAVRHDVLLVGAPGDDAAGSVEVLQYAAGVWTRRDVLTSPAEMPDGFGTSLTLVPGVIHVGAPRSPHSDGGSGLVLVHPETR